MEELQTDLVNQNKQSNKPYPYAEQLEEISFDAINQYIRKSIPSKRFYGSTIIMIINGDSERTFEAELQFEDQIPRIRVFGDDPEGILGGVASLRQNGGSWKLHDGDEVWALGILTEEKVRKSLSTSEL